MENKIMPGFMIYREAALLIGYLKKNEAGELIQAAVSYYLTGEVPVLRPNLQQLFLLLRENIDKGHDAWEKKREAGRKGNEKRWGRASEETEEQKDALPCGSQSDPISNRNTSSSTNTSSSAIESPILSSNGETGTEAGVPGEEPDDWRFDRAAATAKALFGVSPQEPEDPDDPDGLRAYAEHLRSVKFDPYRGQNR